MKIGVFSNILDNSAKKVVIEFAERSVFRKSEKKDAKAQIVEEQFMKNGVVMPVSDKPEKQGETRKILDLDGNPMETYTGKVKPRLVVSVTDEQASALLIAISSHGKEEVDEDGTMKVVTENCFIRLQLTPKSRQITVFIGVSTPNEDLSKAAKFTFELKPHQRAYVKNTTEFRTAIAAQAKQAAQQIKTVGGAILTLTA